MAVTFAVNSVLDRLGQVVIAAMTDGGETPQSLSRATTAEQSAFLAANLPSTVLEVGKLTIGEDRANIGSLRFCQHVTIHHTRALSPGGSAVESATARIAAVCTALYHDYRLESVSQTGDQSVEMVRMTEIMSGRDNPVQQLLDRTDENDSMVVVSLALQIDWTEDNQPAPAA